MQVSEEQINRWANPPSETENEKCENAIKQISGALRLKFGNDICFIRQGSHRNRTNVKLDSDVDLAVVHKNYHFPDLRALSPADKALHKSVFSSADYSFAQFKSDVHSVLSKEFGAGFVQRKQKCIKISGNSYRIDADVVPAYVHKRYRSYNTVSVEGIEFVTDAGDNIHSFPEQHYESGVSKNDETSKAYKSVVRIFKNVRNEFEGKGLINPKDISSFFIESLVWNTPVSYFAGKTWRDDALSVSAKIWNDMKNVESAKKYAEVSNLMWLFHGQRTPEQAESFMLKTWQYLN